MSFVIPPRLKSMLDWKMPAMIPPPSETKSQNVTGKGKKRTVSRHLPFDLDNLPMSAATPPPQTVTNPSSLQSTNKKTTRPPKFYDLHLREDLILKRTAVVPGLAETVALACEVSLESRQPPLEDVPAKYRYTPEWIDRHKVECERPAKSEAKVQARALGRESVAAALSSAILSGDASFPPSKYGTSYLHADSAAELSSYAKALADGYVWIDEQTVHNLPDGHPHKEALAAVINEGLNPFMAYEFKYMLENLTAMDGIRYLCSSDVEFEWTSCERFDWPSPTSCGLEACSCPTDKDRATVTGRPVGFDSYIVETILADAKQREQQPTPRPTPSRGSLNAAKYILQQIWASMVLLDATFMFINCGNHEYLCVRHREAQALFLSDVLEIPRAEEPSHMKVHTGTITLATLDVMIRAKMMKQAKKAVVLPSKYSMASTDHDGRQFLRKPTVVQHNIDEEDDPTKTGIEAFGFNNRPALDLRWTEDVTSLSHLGLPGDVIRLKNSSRASKTVYPPTYAEPITSRSQDMLGSMNVLTCEHTTESGKPGKPIPFFARWAFSPLGGVLLEHEAKNLKLLADRDHHTSRHVPRFGGFFKNEDVHLYLLLVGRPKGETIKLSKLLQANKGNPIKDYHEAIANALRRIHVSGMTFQSMSAEDILVGSHTTATVIFTSMRDVTWWGEESQDPMKEEAEQRDFTYLNNIMTRAQRPGNKRVKSS